MFTNLFKRLLTSANVHLLFWAYKLMMCLGKLSVQTESIVKCNCNYFNCTVKGHICVCVCVWLCVCVCFSLLQQQNKPQREVPLATKVLKQEQTKVRMVIIWVWRQRPKTPITKRTHTRKQLATCLANTLKAESRTHTHTHKHKSTHNWHTTILMQHTFGGLMLEMTTKASGWVGRKGGWVAVAHLPPPPLLLLATRLSLSLSLSSAWWLLLSVFAVTSPTWPLESPLAHWSQIFWNRTVVSGQETPPLSPPSLICAR